MELQHEFTVPVPVDEAWRVLLDIERVAPCMPGAYVETFDGETVQGSVKVKVGPMTVTYRGTAAFQERDESAHRVVLAANGKETRGQGTARATVTGTMTGRPDGTTAVTVATDLAVTGRPAQFGRGVMAEVGDRILGQFADCLADKLSGPATGETRGTGHATESGERTGAATESGPGPGPGPGSGPVPATAPATAPEGGAKPPADLSEAEAVDLLRAAGGPVLKRAAVAAAAVAVTGFLLSRLRRRRRLRRG